MDHERKDKWFKVGVTVRIQPSLYELNKVGVPEMWTIKELRSERV